MSYIGMTKRKLEDRIKEHQRDILLNKSSTAIARLNNKSPITIDFKNVEKLANYNSLNYALIREAIEIISSKSETCNDQLHAVIDNRWRHILKIWINNRENLESKD